MADDVQVAVERLLVLAADFTKLMATAVKMKRGQRYDDEESFRNKANEKAEQIVARLPAVCDALAQAQRLIADRELAQAQLEQRCDPSGDLRARRHAEDNAEALQRELAQAQQEIARLREWASDLQSDMYINCVYCGHRYGPSADVPASMADVLKIHIARCPEHPMSHLRALASTLARELAASQFDHPLLADPAVQALLKD